MKKKSFLLLIFSLFFLSLFDINPLFSAKASSINNSEIKENYGYMKALSSCLFFKTSDITNMSLENIYFTIPEGYFVKKIYDLSQTTIKVTYNNKVGYVMSERVKLVSFLPTVKYLDNITFDILSIYFKEKFYVF